MIFDAVQGKKNKMFLAREHKLNIVTSTYRASF